MIHLRTCIPAAAAAAATAGVFVGVRPPAPTTAPPPGEMTAEAARAMVVEDYREWGRARVAYDRAAMEKMLAPDLYIQVGEQRISRQEFLDQVSTPRPGAKLVRFDVDVLTVQRKKDGGWLAVIAEKLEVERTGADGNTTKDYSLWVTRDTFKEIDGHWMFTSSEASGFETWCGQKPPFADW